MYIQITADLRASFRVSEIFSIGKSVFEGESLSPNLSTMFLYALVDTLHKLVCKERASKCALMKKY